MVEFNDRRVGKERLIPRTMSQRFPMLFDHRSDSEDDDDKDDDG